MKTKWGIILLGVLVFLLGGIAGAVSRYLYCEHAKEKASAPRPIPRVEDVVEAMAQVLKLDTQQKADVKVVISEGRDRYRELWRKFQPQYQQLVQDSDNRIRALLRDEQKPLFETYLKKIKSKQAVPPKPASAN